MAERENERSISQTVRAQLTLRDLILTGALRPGERISELQAVEAAGVSRTPVRMALVRLEEEGLLEAIPSGGFMVKSFSERDVLDSIEIRGTMEGLAARIAAERGVSVRDTEPMRECLAQIDELIAPAEISFDAFSAYVALNARFHALLAELSRSAPVIRQVDRASALPFASPSGFVMAQSALRHAISWSWPRSTIASSSMRSRTGKARAPRRSCGSMPGLQPAICAWRLGRADLWTSFRPQC